MGIKLGLFSIIKGHIALFMLFLSFFVVSANPSTKENIFKTYLPGLVFAVFQGKQSFWIGGENGIFSVTGNQFTVYNAENGLFQGTEIQDIFEDSRGRVWVSTFGTGLFISTTQSHGSIKFESISDIDEKYCSKIEPYDDGVYIACQGRIYTVTNQTLESKLIVDFSKSRESTITFIHFSKGQLFFVLNEHQVYVMDGEDTFRVDSDHDTWKSAQKLSIIREPSGSILIGTSHGLVQVEQKVGYNFKLNFCQNAGEVTHLFFFQNDEIWAVQDGFKTLSINEKGCRLNQIENPIEYKIRDIYDIAVTSEVSFVFSSPVLGISSVTDLSSAVHVMDELPSSKNNIQYSFYSESDSKKSILLAVDGTIYLYDMDQKTYKSLISNIGYVNFISKFSDSSFVIGSDDYGIVILSQVFGSGLIKQVKKELPGFTTSIVISDYYGALVGVLEGEAGLYRLSQNMSFQNLAKGFHVDHLLELKDGRILVDTRFKGISFFEDLKNIVKKENRFDPINNCMIEDNKQRIWLCTDGGGLRFFDRDNRKVTVIDPKFTAGSRFIRELVQDSDGFFWVMTNQGLVRYDHENQTSFKLGIEDGILDVDFEITASINLPDNKILVAGDTSNYIIDTKLANRKIEKRLRQTTEAVLVNLELSERDSRERHQRSDKLFNAKKDNQPLTLTDDEFLFTLTFAANNFIDRDILGFEYRLKGLDDNWINASANESKATYSTLPAGNYTFQVKIDDPKSIVEQPITSLKIKVLPPIWQTWQAYSIYILLAILSFFLFFKYRTYQLNKRNKALEASVLDRTNELAISNQKITELLSQKENLFAQASHEIRTPLSLILGPLEKLLETTSDQEKKIQLSLMQRNAKRLAQLVNQILELAKIDSSVKTERRIYAIDESLKALIGTFEPVAQLKMQKIEIARLQQGRARLIVDSFEKVISNLLINALKYNPANIVVSIDTYKTDQFYFIEISDNGVGIAENELNNIFQRFTRLSSSKNTSGSGLGLALVKELVVANQGLISVESKPSIGTKFTIQFPLSEETVIEEIQESYKPDLTELVAKDETNILITDNVENEIQNKQDTILIIEDNKDMREFLRTLLLEQYHCILAINGKDGLEKALEFMPDLIITDLMMPVTDGFAVADSIRQNELTSHIPIILLTARGDDKSRLQGWAKNVDDYIAKPFSSNELILRVANLLSIRRIIARKFDDSEPLTEEQRLTTLADNDYFTERDRRFFTRFVEVIQKNYAEESFNRTSAAEALAVSERQLNRKLSALINYNFSEYLRKYRLQKAKTLIEEGMQITQVAYECGFASSSYFSSCFKAEFGLAPKAFIERLKST